MQPQLSAFNGSVKGGGIWLTMENKIRDSFKMESIDTMYICRGGTIDQTSQVKDLFFAMALLYQDISFLQLC